MRVRVIDSLDDFSALEKAWDSLLLRSGQDNIFLSHGWLAAWWEVFGTGHRLYILTVADDDSDELVGLFPAYVKAGGGFLPVKVLRFIGSEYVGSDFLDCISARGREQEVVSALLGHLGSRKNDWDLLVLSDIEPTSLFFSEALLNPVFRSRWVDGGAVTCPYLDLPADWETFTKRVSSKQRSKIGYYRRALERKGGVAIESITDPDSVEAALVDLFRIREARMQQKKYRIHFKTDRHFKFHQKVCVRFMADDRLRLKFLNVDNERVAFAYQFQFNDRLYFYQTGFDPAWFKESVGFVLLGYELQKAIESGCTRFEFLRGDESYKYDWGHAGGRELQTVYLYRDSLAAAVHCGMKKVLTVCKGQAKRLLRRR